MSTTIQLDTTAMNNLFPEGSEARVELRQAVLQNVANSFLKSTTNPEIQSMKLIIQRQVNEAVAEKCKDIAKYENYKWNINPDTLLSLRTEAAKIVKSSICVIAEEYEKNLNNQVDAINIRISDYIESKMPNIERKIDLAVVAIFETKIKESITKRVTDALNDISVNVG
jgi:hypothetical protein